MNAKTICFVTFLTSLALTSCEEKNDSVLVIQPIELDTYEFTVPCEGGPFDIRVLSQEEVALSNKYIFYSPEKVDSYSATDIDARWYRVHLDDKTIHVEVGANTSAEERTGGFIVCSAKTHDNSHVSFKQSGKQ